MSNKDGKRTNVGGSIMNSSHSTLATGAAQTPYFFNGIYFVVIRSKNGYHSAIIGPVTNAPYDAHCAVLVQSINDNGFVVIIPDDTVVVVVVVVVVVAVAVVFDLLSLWSEAVLLVECSILFSDHCARISPAIHKFRQSIEFATIGRSSINRTIALPVKDVIFQNVIT
jgi:hypothetical protein